MEDISARQEQPSLMSPCIEPNCSSRECLDADRCVQVFYSEAYDDVLRYTLHVLELLGAVRTHLRGPKRLWWPLAPRR